jgi:hypothetical protein
MSRLVDGRGEARQALDAERLALGVRGRPAFQLIVLVHSLLVVESDDDVEMPRSLLRRHVPVRSTLHADALGDQRALCDRRRR